MARIGVFTCWCGENISRTIDVQQVADAAREEPGVVCSLAYKYMCADPGQNLLRGVLECLPLEEEHQRVRLRTGPAHGHLCSIPPGRPGPPRD